MYISQILDQGGAMQVIARMDDEVRVVKDTTSVHALALDAARSGMTIRALVEKRGLGENVDLESALGDGRVLPPIIHPDAAHLYLTGTGLTHLGALSA